MSIERHSEAQSTCFTRQRPSLFPPAGPPHWWPNDWRAVERIERSDWSRIFLLSSHWSAGLRSFFRAEWEGEAMKRERTHWVINCTISNELHAQACRGVQKSSKLWRTDCDGCPFLAIEFWFILQCVQCYLMAEFWLGGDWWSCEEDESKAKGPTQHQLLWKGARNCKFLEMAVFWCSLKGILRGADGS